MYKEGTQKRELLLKVDVREGAEKKNEQVYGKIVARMRRLGLEDRVFRERMELFDFEFVLKSDRRVTFGPLFERKTASDLAASIKDGRYREQKGRMAALGLPGPCKIFIYEGNMCANSYGLDPKSLLGAMIKPTMAGDNEILKTESMDATADLLVHCFMYLEHLDEKSVEGRGFSYVNYIQPQVRKRDFRDDNKLALMVREFVLGASGPVAQAVADRYGSLGALQGALIMGRSHALTELSNLTYVTPESGATHRIGPAAASKIRDMCDIAVLQYVLSGGTPDDPPVAGGNGKRRKKEKEKEGEKEATSSPHFNVVDDNTDDDAALIAMMDTLERTQ